MTRQCVGILVIAALSARRDVLPVEPGPVPSLVGWSLKYL